MADQRPLREDPRKRLNLTNSDYHPGRSAVADIVQELLDGAAANLLMARSLAGWAVGIPTLEDLTRTWQEQNRRTATRNIETQTPVEEQLEGAATSRGKQTGLPPTPIL